jgi:hypothetical protein
MVERAPEYQAKLQRAAWELHMRLGYYLDESRTELGVSPDDESTRQLEKILLVWVNEVDPERTERYKGRSLASAACQLFCAFERGGQTSDEFIREFVQKVAVRVCGEPWEDEERVVSHATAALRDSRGKDVTRIDGILRAFEGLEPDQRRGVRPDRKVLIEETLSEAPTLTRWRRLESK